MRQTRAAQLPLGAGWTEHQHSLELQEISSLLDMHPSILEDVRRDILGERSAQTGREGLTFEQVLRIAVLKRLHDLDYRTLAFHLADSRSFRTFCRLEFGQNPSFTAVQSNVKRLSASTWEKLNGLVMKQAIEEGLESGRKVRTDTTVVDSAIHKPSDSSLLWDSVRVLTRLMKRVSMAFPVYLWRWKDHRTAAKSALMAVMYARGKKAERDRRRAYRKLLKITEMVVGYAELFMTQTAALARCPIAENLVALSYSEELLHYLPLCKQVIAQTRRRVLEGRQTPAREKVVSLFEPHTDVIVKDRRETRFGHKVTLSGTASNLIADCVIEKGNPADATLAVRSVRRVTKVLGRVPVAVSFDGGFASRPNLEQIKGMGVRNVAFHKKCRLAVSEMVKSSWIYRQLKRFRAGVEGCISGLKRGVGMARCRWRGLGSFRAYVWNCVVSFNLMQLARLRLAKD